MMLSDITNKLMEWYYAKDKVQMGPVDREKLRSLVAAGVIDANTLVWKSGRASWQPYAKAMTSGLPQLMPDGQMGASCSSCGKLFAEGDLIKYENNLICASCKPLVFQRLKETGNVSLGKIWHSGRILVMTRESQLPDFCIKCNAPADGYRLKRKLFWHPPLLYLLILCNLLVYAIVAAIVGKKANIEIGLCEHHRRKRKLAMNYGWGSFLLGIIIIVISAGFDSGLGAFFGLMLLLIGGLAGMALASMVSTREITPEHLFVKGACPEYLARFAEWSGGE